MSWTEDQLDKLRATMDGARRQGAWISAGEAGLVLTLLQMVRRLTMAKGWSGIPSGPPPTIGVCRAQGITSFDVTCSTPQCWSRRRFTFDDLKLLDDVVFVEIPRHRRFRCMKCRGRAVHVMANHPNPLAGTTPGRSHAGNR